MPVQVLHGDCRDILKTIPDCSIDAIVTDPPYCLDSIRKRFGSANAKASGDGPNGEFARLQRGFMNQTWDTDIAFDPAIWAECLRVLKPGGHVAAFGASRTHHRLWCAIEDGGFEIRDTVMWLNSMGFPKSLNISKSIQSLNRRGKPRFDNSDTTAFDEIIGTHAPPSQIFQPTGTWSGQLASVSDAEALAWQGWHTALKPAHEPICLARRPIEGTVAANVLRYGTGGMNIDATRVPAGDSEALLANWDRETKCDMRGGNFVGGESGGIACTSTGSPLGRWPANVCHDGSDEVLEAFPQRESRKTVKHKPMKRTDNHIFGHGLGSISPENTYDDDGSAARFFYCAKAGKRDRAGSGHPTVKPVSLMEWLVRMITPPEGIVLDLFAGSGTTGEACVNLGFDCILIEREAKYVADIERRLKFFVSP